VALKAEAAADDLRSGFDLSGMFVDRNDGQHDAVFGNQAAVANHHITDHLTDRSRIDADAPHRDTPRFARACVIDFQNVAGLADEGLFEPDVAEVLSKARMLRKLPVLAVNGDKIAWAHEVQHEPQLFHRAVSGNVQGRIQSAV